MVGQHYIKIQPKPFMGRIACKSKALNLIFAYTMMYAWTKHDPYFMNKWGQMYMYTQVIISSPTKFGI